MSRRHRLGSRIPRVTSPREKLQVVEEIFKVLSGQTRPSRHLVIERVARRIDAHDDRRFDGLPIKDRMTPAGGLVVVALRIDKPEESNIGGDNTMHGAPAPVRAMTHRAPDALHSVAVLNELASGRRAMHKNSAAIVSVAGRDYHGASER